MFRKTHLILTSLLDLSALRQQWLQDIPDLDMEDTEDVGDQPFSTPGTGLSNLKLSTEPI